MMKTTYYTYDKLKFVYTEEELGQVIDEILKAYDEKTFRPVRLK